MDNRPLTTHRLQPTKSFHLFEAFGVELEYMIVESGTLAVKPIADEVLRAGEAARRGIPKTAVDYVADVVHHDISWSNELVLHVLELKTAGPAPRLEGLADAFQNHVSRINGILAGMGARLMPGGMHLWMNPKEETRLWPHEGSEVYQAFDRIFDCRRHGWANLQSVHLNLPFAGDEEFGRLHAAIRLVLPILPALAASSPIMDGRITGTLDNRLAVYRTNCSKIPSLTGCVIPEPVFTEDEYREILQRCYRDIAPHDPDGLLQDEFINARGAIARFCRNTIEIRLLDMQERPQADIAICTAIVAVLRALVEERWCSWDEQKRWAVEPLEKTLLATIRDADQAVIANTDYLRAFGVLDVPACAAGELWRRLVDPTPAQTCSGHPPWRPKESHRSVIGDSDLAPLTAILREGPLARRILSLAGPGEKGGRNLLPERPHGCFAQNVPDPFFSLGIQLCHCLFSGSPFSAARAVQPDL